MALGELGEHTNLICGKMHRVHIIVESPESNCGLYKMLLSGL
jgi:hypothetical protein